MLKLGRRARGHFVTLIETRVHCIRSVSPNEISRLFKKSVQSITFLVMVG